MVTERWVSKDEAALLCTALGSGDDAARHWTTFTSLFDFDDIWDDERYSLLPAVHVALEGIPGIVEAPRLAGIHRRTWFANQTGLAAAAQTVTLLADGGVPACLHGDLAIAATLCADIGMRVTGGSEILVAAEDAGAALRDAGRNGWQRVGHAPLDRFVAHTDGALLNRDRTGPAAAGVGDLPRRGRLGGRPGEHPRGDPRCRMFPAPSGAIPVPTADVLAVNALCAGVGSQPGHRLRSLWDAARMLAATPSGAGEAVDLDAVLGRIEHVGVGPTAAHTLTAAAALTADRRAGAEAFVAAVVDLPVAAADRHRQERLVSTAGRAGRTRQLRSAWTRRAIGLSSAQATRTAPGFLAARWGLRSEAMLPVEIARRTARAVAASVPARSGRPS